MAANKEGEQARGGKGKGKRARKATLAERADRHALYQESVQCTEAEIDFIDETFETLRRRKASILREDFAGTANTSCEWVRRRGGNRAIAIDLDAEVQDWGLEHNIKALGRAARRVQVLNANVLDVQCEAVDAIVAHNFSYWLFKERAQLRHYFERVRAGLVNDGLFFLDAYGGYEAPREIKERTRYDRFTYIWDQAAFNPINSHMLCHIHFHFPDGSKLRRAYTYTWRLWTLPEIRELLAEAGFSRSTVYWQGTDEDTGEGNGVFEPSEQGDADPGWIVYIVAEV